MEERDADGMMKFRITFDQHVRLVPSLSPRTAMLAEETRVLTIKAETDLTCYGMTSWDFRPLVESNASIAWNMLQVMAQRLKEAQTP